MGRADISIVYSSPNPPMFRSFEFQATAVYPRMRKYISKPKKLYAMQENSVLFSLNLQLQKS